jgi:hypothetical protein
MKIYGLSACDSLIDRYVNEYKGEATTIREGVLGLGELLLHNAKGKKSIVIKEVYLNDWSSGHTIKKYNKLPKKYLKILNDIS